MKKSHLVTPRSMAECSFFASADPIERPAENRAADRAVWITLVGCLLVVALVLAAEKM